MSKPMELFLMVLVWLLIGRYMAPMQDWIEMALVIGLLGCQLARIWQDAKR